MSPYRRLVLLLLLACLPGVAGRLAAATVRFELPEYTVAVGEFLDLRVLIDHDQGEPADLFSYGVRVELLEPGAANLVTLGLPLALDYDGVNGAPAAVDVDPAVLGAKGTINVFEMPQVPYTGSLLATYQMQFVQVGTVRLKLHPYNTLGPTEDIFVSGNGMSLDDFVVFRETEVNVIPEPAVTWAAVLTTWLLAGRRRRTQKC